MNINEIANLANGNKTNRKDAFAIVHSMIDRGEATEIDLASLYAFFLPKIPAKPKTVNQWVAKAMGKNDVRYYLNYLYSDGSRLIATDGHRLHIKHDVTKLEPGYYNTELVKINVDATYPNIDRIIPSEGDRDIMTLDDFSHLPIVVSGQIQTVTIRNSQFNQQYIRDAVSIFSKSVPIELIQADDNSPIRLVQGSLTAIVMLTRV